MPTSMRKEKFSAVEITKINYNASVPVSDPLFYLDCEKSKSDFVQPVVSLQQRGMDFSQNTE